MLIDQCVSNVGCFTLNLVSGLLIVSAYAFCITKYTSLPSFELFVLLTGKARIREGKVRPMLFLVRFPSFNRVKNRTGRRLLHV